jgi:hypothetical protein
MAPMSVFAAHRETEPLPTTVTFMVNAAQVYSPQTGHPWFIEMDREMSSPKIYSLVPQKSDNQYVSHYRVETRRPRFNSEFEFMDSWVTTNHRFCGPIHFSQTFFNPERANDKLYFERPPKYRMEILVPGFIGDREIFQILETVVPKEYEIRSLLQRQP